MKLVLSAAFAAAALSLTFVGAAAAMPPTTTQTTCTTSPKSAEVPMGKNDDGHGHIWAGLKKDGSLPESLVASGGDTTTCVTTTVDNIT